MAAVCEVCSLALASEGTLMLCQTSLLSLFPCTTAKRRENERTSRLLQASSRVKLFVFASAK